MECILKEMDNEIKSKGTTIEFIDFIKKLVLKNSNNILDFFNCSKEEIFFLQNSLINSMEDEVKTKARNLEITELVNNLKTEVFFYLTSERLHDKIY